MKTHLDCLPCFLKQALGAARAVVDDEDVLRRVLNSVADMVPQFSLSVTPSENAQQSYRLVYQIIGNHDPFRQAKEEANRKVMSLYPHLKEVVANSADPLFTAGKLAIAGNSIDYIFGSYHGDIDEIVADALASPLRIDDYAAFRDSVRNSRRILYLGDNAGEIVFDRVFIEELKKVNKPEITFVVRGKPVINDATMDDAISVGLDKVVRVVSNGSDAPGTVLSQCPPEVLELYHSADTIIVKGQGNYESLSEEDKNMFFFMKTKCAVVVRLLGTNLGDPVLKQQLKGQSGK